MDLLTISESYCTRDGRVFSFHGGVEQVDDNLFRPFNVMAIDKQSTEQWPLDLGYIQCDRAALRDMFREQVRSAIDALP